MKKYFLDTNALSFSLGLLKNEKYDKQLLLTKIKQHKLLFSSRTMFEFYFRHGIENFRKLINEFWECSFAVIYTTKDYNNNYFCDLKNKSDKELNEIINKVRLQTKKDDAELFGFISFFPMILNYKIFENIFKYDKIRMKKLNNLIDNQSKFNKKTLFKILSQKEYASRDIKDIVKKFIGVNCLATSSMLKIYLDFYDKKDSYASCFNKLISIDEEYKIMVKRMLNFISDDFLVCMNKTAQYNFSELFTSFQEFIYKNNPLTIFRQKCDEDKKSYTVIEKYVLDSLSQTSISKPELQYYKKYCIDFYLKEQPGIDPNDITDILNIIDYLNYDKNNSLYITLDDKQQKHIKAMNETCLNESLNEINDFIKI